MLDKGARTLEARSNPANAGTEQAAAGFVQMATTDEDQPVVLFALEWCEFCWSIRRLFKELGIEYRSIDLDSVDYQKKGWGGEVRVALRKVTGAPTIPQIFVGGQHVGGAPRRSTPLTMASCRNC